VFLPFGDGGFSGAAAKLCMVRACSAGLERWSLHDSVLLCSALQQSYTINSYNVLYVTLRLCI
jgi:hypothetical protein